MLPGHLEKLFGGPCSQRGKTGHFEIGGEKAAEQALFFGVDLGSNEAFQLRLQQGLTLGDVILHRVLRHPSE